MLGGDFYLNWPLFTRQGGKLELYKAISRLYPDTIVVGSPSQDSDVVLNALRHLYKFYTQESGETVCFINKLDLRGTEVNKIMCEFISHKLIVKDLRFSQMKRNSGDFLKPKFTEKLTVTSSNYFSAHALNAEDFMSLIELDLTECMRINFQTICEFLKTSKRIEKLKITDCWAYEENFFLCNFLETVYSKDCNLKSFTFNYSKGKIKHTTINFQPVLYSQPNLIFLDFSFNIDLVHLIPKLVLNAPEVKELVIKGLEIDDLNLAFNLHLEKLVVDDLFELDKLLSTVFSPKFEYLVVESRLSFKHRQKIKNLLLFTLKSIIDRDGPFKAEFYKCWLNSIPDWLEDYKHKKKVTYEKIGGTFVVEKVKQLVLSKNLLK